MFLEIRVLDLKMFKSELCARHGCMGTGQFSTPFSLHMPLGETIKHLFEVWVLGISKLFDFSHYKHLRIYDHMWIDGNPRHFSCMLDEDAMRRVPEKKTETYFLMI